MQPVSPRVVELLNDALTFELTVTNTYFLHARMLDSWGFGRLGKVYYDLSIDEMRDADELFGTTGSGRDICIRTFSGPSDGMGRAPWGVCSDRS